MASHGYVSQSQLDNWLIKLRESAFLSIGHEADIERELARAMQTIYQRLVVQGRAVEAIPGSGRFTITQVAPSLRAELDRRILVSADLIKLNRRQAVEKTLQRFSGWSTSIPPGGSGVIDKREVREQVAKSVAQFKYERRRVAIDQGHKLAANVSEIIAQGAGAIGAVWRSHWRQAGYDYRPDHKERDGTFYFMRDSWALEAGLIKRGGPYVDEITRPAEEPFCRCNYQWVTRLSGVPHEMLTHKGREKIAELQKFKQKA